MIIAWLNLHRFCQTADVVQSQRILQEQEAHLTSVQGNLNKCLSTYECSVLQASKLKVCENLEANSEARKVIDSKISSYDDLANALKSLFQIPQLKLGWDLSN